MFEQLPAELRLKTLAHLTVRDLRSAQLVCRSWQEFFAANESAIYRHTAVVHGFAQDSEASLAEACLRGSIVGVDSWKDLVRRRFRLETNWQGLTQPTVKEFRSSGNAVHRIKVDEEAGYIITTSKEGGLWVTDLYRNEVLWSLPQEHVCECAHCEYGDGYIVFNRIDNVKEVWRRACDFHNATLPAESLPDELQLRASAGAAEFYHSRTLRGHFLPWALVDMPVFGRAFRFVYPNLLVASEDEAFVWDIPTMRNIITIHDTQTPVDGAILGLINYVELSDRYIIICGTGQLRIFSKSPQGALLYHIPTSTSTYAKSTLDLSNEYERGTPGIVLSPLATRRHAKDITATAQPLPPHLMRFDGFVAAHIAPCGSVLVALLKFGRVLIVTDLEHVVNGTISLAQSALEVNLHSLPVDSIPSLEYNSTYLALGDGRIAAATCSGIYVMTLNYRAHGIVTPKEIDVRSQGATSALLPNFTVSQAVCFDNPVALFSLSCLQMTATGLFVTWSSPVTPQSPQHQTSPNAPEQYFAVESHNEDEVNDLGSAGLSDVTGLVDENESMFEENNGEHVLETMVESSNAVQLVELQPLWGEDAVNDSYFSDLLSVSDSSSNDDQLEELASELAISTVVCIDFLPE